MAQEVPTCQVIILTALAVEFRAVVTCLQETQEIIHPQGTIYRVGHFPGKTGPLQVAVAQISMGGGSAALETERAIQFFRPRLSLLVGIAGGLKDVRLGDVVAAIKVYAYESGKAGHTFEPRPEVWRASYPLEQRARHEVSGEAWLAHLNDPRPDPMPCAHVGALAAGEKVLASTQSATYRQIRATYNDAVAIEMEGHGFLQAIHANHNMHGLVIRGISDVVDDKAKADAAGWQEIAARHAAAFAFHILATFTFPSIDHPPSPVAIWNVPYHRNPFFTGRDHLLSILAQALDAKHPIALSQPQAISGLGGIGKTQFAVEYAYRSMQRYQMVFWVNAETQESIISGYGKIAELLNLREKDEKDQQLMIKAVQQWLQRNTCWLLILDNADDLSLVQPFMPPVSGGHILLTTRAQATGYLANHIEIDTLLPSDGALLLLRRAKVLSAQGFLEEAEKQDVALAYQISEDLGGLPLALDQAGAYIEEKGCSLTDYQRLYRTRRIDILRNRGAFGYDHPKPVATTWSLSFEQVEQQNPAAADLLRLCAFLASDAIPEELLTEGAKGLGDMQAPVVADAYQLNQAIATLRAYSLISRDPRSHTLMMHRLVQAVLKDSLNREEHEVWRKRVIRMVEASLPIVSFSNWKQCEQWLPHAQVCVKHEEDVHQWIRETARISHWTGAYLLERYHLQEAESYLQQALNWRVAHPGDNVAATNSMISTLDRLALLRVRQGKYDEAEPMYQQALNLSILLVGLNHRDTAMSFSNLASLYQVQGRYAEAEPLFEQAFAIFEQLGANDSDIATCLDHLGCVSLGQGKYAEAESLLQRALALSEEQLGTNHPDTLATLSSRAVACLKQSRYAEAEPLLQRALIGNEEQLGTNHPHTVDSLHSLAGFYQQQGRHTDAEPLFKKALVIAEQQLGIDHPTTGMYLTHLGDCYREQGQYAEAEPLYQRALTIAEQQWGPQHPEVGSYMTNLAYIYHLQGKYANAEPLYQQTLAIANDQLGIDHPTTGMYLTNLAHLYQHQDRFFRAEVYYNRALAIAEQYWGTEHPTTGSCLEDLAELYQQQGRYTDAESHFKKAVAIAEQQLGVEHPITQTVKEKYAALLRVMSQDGETKSI